GRFPFWCHSVAAGVPIFAHVQLGLLYPLNLINLFISPAAVILPLAFIHYSLGCFFFYLYARRIKLTRSAALAGAFVFVFNDFIMKLFSTLSDLNTLIWLPLLLFFLEDGVIVTDKGRIVNYRAAIAAGCVLGMQILAGFLVYVYLSMIMAGFYFVLLWQRIRYSGSNFLSAVNMLGSFFIVFLFIGLGVGSAVIIPFYEQFGFLAKQEQTFIQLFNIKGGVSPGFSLFDWISLLLKEVGYIPFILSFLFIYPVNKYLFREYRLFYALIILLLLILILSNNTFATSFLLDHLPLPFFKMIKYVDRLRLLLFFSFAVLTSIRISAITEKMRERYKRWGGFLQLFLPFSIFLFLIIYSNNFNKQYLIIYPQESESKVISYLKKNQDYSIKTYYDLSNHWIASGINLCSARSLLLSKKYFQFTGASTTRALIKQDDSLMDFLTYPNLIDTLGCKYVVVSRKYKFDATKKILATNSFLKKVYVDSDFEVYLNKNVMPKAFLYTQWKSVSSSEDALNLLMMQDFDAHQSAVIEGNSLVMNETRDVSSFTRVITYSDNEVIILTRSASDGWLVLFDMSYPGWQVYVDGQKRNIVNADFLFRGVFLTSGEHRIKFVYYPLSVIIGFSLTILTIGLAIFLLAKKKVIFSVLPQV
ncbi:MAG: YfhO family protein, partial [Candidatus Omnitrophota bacterium]